MSATDEQRLTPEQAVEAALGRGTCRMELRDTGNDFEPGCTEEYLMCDHCKFVGYYVCASEDGDYWCDIPSFCPSCGRAVRRSDA